MDAGAIEKWGKSDLLFSRPRDVYADRFDSVVYFCGLSRRRPPRLCTKGRDRLLYITCSSVVMCARVWQNICGPPRGGTSSANILAVFAAADENKNFLFSFLRNTAFHGAYIPFRDAPSPPPTAAPPCAARTHKHTHVRIYLPTSAPGHDDRVLIFCPETPCYIPASNAITNGGGAAHNMTSPRKRYCLQNVINNP